MLVFCLRGAGEHSCYENRVFPVRPEPVEGPFMVRQAHHERRPAHLFLLSVVPIIGMIVGEPLVGSRFGFSLAEKKLTS